MDMWYVMELQLSSLIGPFSSWIPWHYLACLMPHVMITTTNMPVA